jgi:hypothetical protein
MRHRQMSASKHAPFAVTFANVGGHVTPKGPSDPQTPNLQLGERGLLAPSVYLSGLF